MRNGDIFVAFRLKNYKQPIQSQLSRDFAILINHEWFLMCSWIYNVIIMQWYIGPYQCGVECADPPDEQNAETDRDGRSWKQIQQISKLSVS